MAFSSNNCNILVIVAAVSFLIVIMHTDIAEAKRGCASFGHSCYGGMGKRASSTLDTNEEVLQNVIDEENPAFVFTGPRSSYNSKPYDKLTPQQYASVNRVIRQWIRNSLRRQMDDTIQTPNNAF